MEDVDVKEFVRLLQVVYPSHKITAGESVQFLLKLGDRFRIQYVTNKCIKFLMKTDEIATGLIGTVWRVCKMHHSILHYRDIEEVEELKNTIR